MFVVTTQSGSAPANSVSLVVPLSSEPAEAERLSAELTQLLAAHPADVEVVVVGSCAASAERGGLERLALTHPLRVRLVRIDQPTNVESAVMEGLVRARGRTIALLPDARPESLARFTALLVSRDRSARRRSRARTRRLPSADVTALGAA